MFFKCQSKLISRPLIVFKIVLIKINKLITKNITFKCIFKGFHAKSWTSQFEKYTHQEYDLESILQLLETHLSKMTFLLPTLKYNIFVHNFVLFLFFNKLQKIGMLQNVECINLDFKNNIFLCR